MTFISASVVKELRTRTGAGIVDCKKALEVCDGDIERAITHLRQKGLSDAAKKAGRVANEGLVCTLVEDEHSIGAMVQVNCETDFVAQNSLFRGFVDNVARLVAAHAPGDVNQLLNYSMQDGRTVGDTLRSLINTFGENITITRFVRFQVGSCGAVFSYVHEDYLTSGKIGVLLEATVSHSATLLHPAFTELLTELVLHIAAAKPKYVRREDVPVDVFAEEASIYRSRALNDGNSEVIAERVAQGRIHSYIREYCLLEQLFVKDTSVRIADLLDAMNRKLGGENICINKFARFEKGEAE